jgi:two-component system sensor histidine kinase DesK
VPRLALVLSSPAGVAGLSLLGGALALTVPVQAGLAGAGSALAGTLTLLVLLSVHARFLLGMLARSSSVWWLVAAQAWLTYLPLALFGAAWTPMCGLLSGALLITAGRLRSVALAVTALACGPVVLAAPHPSMAAPGWAVAAPVLGLLEYALVNLATRADRLAAARADDVHRTVTLERRRFSRDLHDLLGHRLTALVLKTQLIERLVDEGNVRARMEVGETLRLLRSLTCDVRSVAHGDRRSSLEAELASVRALLESVGVSCRIGVSAEVEGNVADALVHALREGVTNVLRHAEARNCAIHLLERDDVVRLSIINDGVARRGGTPGQGLMNLTERLAVLGGWLEVASADGNHFTFTVCVPRMNKRGKYTNAC